jgi:hypothetical protein
MTARNGLLSNLVTYVITRVALVSTNAKEFVASGNPETLPNKSLDANGTSGLVIDILPLTQLSPAASTQPFGRLALIFSNERKTCRQRAARGSHSIELNDVLRVAPPRFSGLLHTASLALNRSAQRGRRALNLTFNGRPNKSLQRSAHSVTFIRKIWRLVALRARPLNSGVGLLTVCWK